MGKLESHHRRHPRAGQRVTIKNGNLKGQIFYVVDFLTTMHQGKDIKKIKAEQYTTAVKNRGLPVDENVVFGQFYPTMNYGCVHDSELRVKLETVKGEAKEELPPNVEKLGKKRKKKDDAEKSPQ